MSRYAPALPHRADRQDAFIVEDLDDTHVLVKSDYVETLRQTLEIEVRTRTRTVYTDRRGSRRICSLALTARSADRRDDSTLHIVLYTALKLVLRSLRLSRCLWNYRDPTGAHRTLDPFDSARYRPACCLLWSGCLCLRSCLVYAARSSTLGRA